ncbi:MAG: 5-oxoprolinase subunit PxpB [Aminivibrio sp.]
MEEKKYPRILTAGDGCVVIEYGDTIDMGINSRVAALGAAVRGLSMKGIRDTVPTYRSLAVYYDPEVAEPDELYARLEKMAEGGEAGASGAGRRIMVAPTLYGGEHGPDLANVAAHTKLSEEEVIKRHAAHDCYCYMLGFTPGFPYLGGMDETIATPRLKNPRELIPGGSVGVAGKQTGIYSIDSPGGWQLIGRTPMRIFDAQRDPPIFLEAGMWVRFRPIDRDEYDEIAAASKAGTYRPEIIEEGGDAR